MNQGQTSYPLEVLPLSCYKKRLNIDKLLNKYNELMVVRLVHGNTDKYKIITDKGEERISDSVFENSMVNLSMNLAGGKFNTNKEAHLPYLTKSEYGISEWNGKHVDKKEFLYKENYMFNSPCFGLCFLVKDIHETTFPFHKSFNSQAERDNFKQDVQKATKDWHGSYDAKLVSAFENKHVPVTVRGRLKIHHMPTNGNYWHVTLDTYRPQNKKFVNPSEKQNNPDKKMFKALKQILIQGDKYKIDTIPKYKISRQYYIKWYALIIPFINL